MARVYKTTYKDISGIAVETEYLRAVYLPEFGGKLASLVYLPSTAELLAQASGKEYLPLSMTSSYVESECSAFDDMFPNIDPQDGGYPCHGEVCRGEHMAEADENGLSLHYDSVLLPFTFEKTVTESHDGGLKISYRIINNSEKTLPCLWAGHIMLAASEGGRVIIPGYEQQDDIPVEISFDEKNEFGSSGTVTMLSEEMLCSKPYSPDGNAYKFYLINPISDGRIYYTRPDLGLKIGFKTDAEKVPYLGIWMNNGIFKGMYNAAVEPCTAPFDNPDKAVSHGYRAELGQGETLEFSMSFTVEAYSG